MNQAFAWAIVNYPPTNPSQAPETVRRPIDRTGDQGQSNHAGRQAGVIRVSDGFRRIP